MSNNNTILQSNNSDLQAILDTINALPEAGSGEPTLQDKTVTPTTSQQTVIADEGYDGLDTVTVNAIPSNYITTDDATASAGDILNGKTAYVDGKKITGNIATKTSSNLTASDATVTVPAGYYASNATKSVSTATQATPSISIDSNGKITASATQNAGYVSAGTKSGTKQMTTQAAKTITPSTSSQTAVAKNVYTTGAVTVAAIPNDYIVTTDATAQASEIFNGETAYVNGNKVTGTFTIDNEISAQDTLLANIKTALQGKASGVDTSDATAAASDILSGKTAYSKDGKVTGTIATKTSNDLTVSGATVTVPAGYYASDGSKSVPTAIQATPSVSIDTNGKITATATQTAGYVVAGTKSGTKQLTTQAAKTITPSTSSQTAVESGVYTTGKVTVAAIPSTYVKPTATKSATTYTPTTTNQTIAAGTYLSGTQTIKGDSNLVAANIVSGKTIFGVTGTASTGTNTSDATATADEIFKNKTAYTKNGKVTGTFTISDEISTQANLISNIQSTLSGKVAGNGNGNLNSCRISIESDTGDTDFDLFVIYWSYSEKKYIIQSLSQTSGINFTTACETPFMLISGYFLSTWFEGSIRLIDSASSSEDLECLNITMYASSLDTDYNIIHYSRWE